MASLTILSMAARNCADSGGASFGSHTHTMGFFSAVPLAHTAPAAARRTNPRISSRFITEFPPCTFRGGACRSALAPVNTLPARFPLAIREFGVTTAGAAAPRINQILTRRQRDPNIPRAH